MSNKKILSGLLIVAGCMASVTLIGCGSTIHDLVAHGSFEEVKAIVAHDPEQIHARDGKQKTPLHTAVTYKQMDVMAFLLEQGADINSVDMTGMTPLHVAAMLGRRDEAAWLLDHGASPLVQDNYGDMPLHTAALFGHGQIIELLLHHGIDPAAPNGNGETARTIAHNYRQERVVKYIDKLQGKS